MSLPVGRDCERAAQPGEPPSQNLTEISGHQRAETPKASGGETAGNPESSGSKFGLRLPIATPEAGRQSGNTFTFSMENTITSGIVNPPKL